jgi:hypothetical protein
MASVEGFLTKRLRLRVNKTKSARPPEQAQVPGLQLRVWETAAAAHGTAVADPIPKPGADLTRRTRGKSLSRSSKNYPATPPGGAATSASARPRRCCANSTGAPGDGCAPSPGSNGNAGPPALPSCDAAASPGTWRQRPPPAHMAPGAEQQPRAHHCAPKRLLHLARSGDPRRNKGALIHRTAVYRPARTVAWEGEGARPTPIPILPVAIA